MTRSEPTNLPFFERPDLSPFLVHLTKNTDREDGFTAYDNLVSILRGGQICGSNTKKGFVKGPNRAACFMDIPLASLKYVLNEANTDPDAPRYEPYGIVVSKEFAYRKGCRPVMYLSNDELQDLDIPESELWRVVRFEGVDKGSINWVHEREWRAKGNFRLPTAVRAVLVKDVKEAKRLQQSLAKNRSKYKAPPSSIIPLSVLCGGLPYIHVGS